MLGRPGPRCVLCPCSWPSMEPELLCPWPGPWQGWAKGQSEHCGHRQERWGHSAWAWIPALDEARAGHSSVAQWLKPHQHPPPPSGASSSSSSTCNPAPTRETRVGGVRGSRLWPGPARTGAAIGGGNRQTEGSPSRDSEPCSTRDVRQGSTLRRAVAPSQGLALQGRAQERL